MNEGLLQFLCSSLTNEYKTNIIFSSIFFILGYVIRNSKDTRSVVNHISQNGLIKKIQYCFYSNDTILKKEAVHLLNCILTNFDGSIMKLKTMEEILRDYISVLQATNDFSLIYLCLKGIISLLYLQESFRDVFVDNGGIEILIVLSDNVNNSKVSKLIDNILDLFKEYEIEEDIII